jgi:hypothetical protein
MARLVVAPGAEQVFILTGYPDWGRWMIPPLIVLCLLAVGVLIGAHLPWRFTRNERMTRLLMPALAFGLVALMIGLTLWAAIPIFQGTESDLPLAGPSFGQDGPGGGFQPMMQTNNTKLIRYLEANQGNAQILVAVAGMVDEIILATNKPVIPLVGNTLHPCIANAMVWGNASKLLAVAGNAVLSYLIMRFWIFASGSHHRPKQRAAIHSAVSGSTRDALTPLKKTVPVLKENITRASLSVILPAYNEEAVIACTVADVLETLATWTLDFEVIVVNDGSHDRTGAILDSIAAAHPRLAVIHHGENQFHRFSSPPK